MELAFLAALFPTVAYAAYVAGRLRELVALNRTKDEQISALKQENAAMLNRLTLKEGASPIFDGQGNIVIKPPGYSDDGNPVMTILRPPFAQAEHDWEQEDIENRPPAMSDFPMFATAFVPEMSEDEKDRLRKTYK